MSVRTSKYIENKIRRLTREIKKIDDFFYEVEKDGNRAFYVEMLERKRDDIVRSVVLQLHTAIEDILTSWIICRVLDIRVEEQERRARNKSGKALQQMLRGNRSIGFDMKLNFAIALRLINTPTQKKLVVLNQLRNTCSHNWLLKMPVRRGKRPKQKKQPLLRYKGNDLYEVKTLEDFIREYISLYVKLFTKYIKYT